MALVKVCPVCGVSFKRKTCATDRGQRRHCSRACGYQSQRQRHAAPTARQLELVAAIARLAERLGYPPTLREMAAELGVSNSLIVQMVDALVRKGVLARTPNTSRSVRLAKVA